MRGLAGVRVVSDGQVIGTTDDLGVALCQTDRPIKEYEVRLSGWTQVDSELSDDPKLLDGIGLVFMVRD